LILPTAASDVASKFVLIRTAASERSQRTAQGYRRSRGRDCGKQFNERSESLLNRTQYPSDVIALVVLWRLRYKLSLRDLPEMALIRGIVFSHEAVCDWEAKLAPGLAEGLRYRQHGKVGVELLRRIHKDQFHLGGLRLKNRSTPSV
jgi:hypothetical protein